MNLNIEVLETFIMNMTQTEYIFSGIFIAFIIFFIHVYSLRQEKKKLIKTVHTHEKVFQKACDAAKDAILILSENFEVTYANKAMIALLELEDGFEHGTLSDTIQLKVSQNWLGLNNFIQEQTHRIDKNVLSFPQSYLKTSPNKVISIHLYLDKLVEYTTKVHYYTLTIHDLTENNNYIEQTYKHTITQLPNQLKAIQDIPALFSKIHIENNKIALALLSFDNFTRLRSIIGYEQSNEILNRFARQLSAIVNDMHIKVYHTFDNHFLLTISNVNSIERIQEVIKNLQEKVAEQYKVGNVNLNLTFSAGIAIYPDSGPTRNLLDNTYKALEIAQNLGDGYISVYLPDKLDEKFDELRLHNEMKSSLEKGEFEVYYQPIVLSSNEEVVAAEALIRWIHPELGFIPPDVFIGIMEKTGFIIQLGRFVLEEVLKQQKRWELFKFKKIEVSINVSMVEIATGEFVEHVQSQLAYHQINPSMIKFEITEGVAMINESKTSKYFRQLKKMGIGLSLDDFGTGYTSFTYLKKFPANVIKIDKSLVDYIVSSDEDRRIVKAMIDLGHNLGMKIVVEGVETREMVEMLVSLGCDYMQGYYFAKPLQVFEFQKLLR